MAQIWLEYEHFVGEHEVDFFNMQISPNVGAMRAERGRQSPDMRREMLETPHPRPSPPQKDAAERGGEAREIPVNEGWCTEISLRSPFSARHPAVHPALTPPPLSAASFCGGEGPGVRSLQTNYVVAGPVLTR